MTANENMGLAIRTNMVRDENDLVYDHIAFELGILSAAIAIPHPNTPAVADAIKKALLKQYRDTEEALGKLIVVKDKLILPGQDN